MARRALAAVVSLAIVAAGGAWAVGALFTESDGGPRRIAPPRHSPKAKPWSGSASRTIDATFIRSGDQVYIERFDFAGLDRAATTLRARLVIVAAGGRARWARRRAFAVRSATGRRWRPAVSARRTGRELVLTLTFRGLPTLGLGPSCGFKTASPLALRVRSPGGAFEVAVRAAPAPAGHCLAERPLKRPRRGARGRRR